MREPFVKAGIAAVVAIAVVMLVWSCWESQQANQAVARYGQSHDQLVQSHVEVRGVTEDMAREAVRQRIVKVPDDGEAYHVSLFLHDDYRKRPLDRSLVAWWEVDPVLKSVKAQTHFHTFLASNPLYKSRFAKAVPTLPAVMIQKSEGKVMYKASGANLPPSPWQMSNDVARLFKNRPYYVLPWRRPKPCPTPGPKPDPLPDENDGDIIIDTVIPDTVLQARAQPGFPWGIGALVVLAAAGISFYVNMRRGL